MMLVAFILIAVVIVAGALGAMFLRSLVHCALSLAVSFSGFAALYLQLGAQFVGLVQLLVYVGAVAILVVFAILLTCSGGKPVESILSPSAWAGAAVAALVFLSLAAAAWADPALGREAAGGASDSTRAIGDLLMSKYVLPLEVMALLLTVALIGAVIIAMHEKEGEP